MAPGGGGGGLCTCPSIDWCEVVFIASGHGARSMKDIGLREY